MKKINHISIYVIFLTSSLWAQEPSAHELALKGIDLATRLRYEEAVDVFDKIIELEPDNPRGYFLKSAVYFWMFSEDIKNEKIGDKFRDFSFNAAEIAESRLEDNEKDIDALFYLGGAYGSLGRYYTMTESYLKAYWYGKKGKNYLEDVVEMDSTYYDAYLGLGIFHYLADVLPRFVKILSFIFGIHGDKELGIRELALASTKGVYTKTEAMFFLAAIYTYRERKYEEAIAIFHDLLEKYPDNPGAQFSLGRCYSFMGECDKALEIYNKVLDNKKGQSLLPRGSIYYQIGEVYFKKNDFEKAKGYYLQAIATDTVEVGKRRWITPRSHFKVAYCYEILGDINQTKHHLDQIYEEDNERAYEMAQERKESLLKTIDIRLMKIQNSKKCNQFDLALKKLEELEREYEDSTDVYIQSKLLEAKFRNAEIFYEQKNFTEAIDLFIQVIDSEIEKDEWLEDWSYYYLGNCYKALERYEDAEDAYDEAEGSDDDWLLSKIEDERKELPEE